MTTYTSRPNVSSAIGWTRRESATYLTALSGGGTQSANPSAGSLAGGDQLSGGIYYLSQTQMRFPLSLPAGLHVSDVTVEWTTTTFNVSGGGGQKLLQFTGGTVGSGTFVNQTSANALTQYGSVPSTGYQTGDTTYQLSLNAAARAYVEANPTGNFDILWCSDRFLAGTAPTGNQQYYLYSDDDGTASHRPALIVTYTTDVELAVPSTALTLLAKIPAVLLDVALAVPSTALAVTVRVPTVALGAAVQVPAKSVALTGRAPTVVTDNLVAVPKGTMTLSANAPGLLIDAAVSVPAKSVLLTVGVPSVAVDRLVAAPSASLSLAAVAPAVASDRVVNIPAALLALSGLAPTLPIDNLLSIPKVAMRLSGLSLQRAGALWSRATPDATTWVAVDADSSTWTPTTGSTTTWTPVTPADD